MRFITTSKRPSIPFASRVTQGHFYDVALNTNPDLLQLPTLSSSPTSENLMQQEPLPTNAISTIIIDDLVKNERGEFVSVTLHRRLPEPAKGYRTLQPSVLPDGPPERLLSKLPPPGTLQLTLSIRELLGDGRCGSVYTISLRYLNDPEDTSMSLPQAGLPFLPELIVKVADQPRLEDIANEAALYDEMESLQGVAIPLCYGWYHAELDLGCTLLSSDTDTEHANSVQIEKPTSIPVQLSLLLLERMGDLLPLGEPIPDRSDLWAIFSDLSQLGIDQPDMRYSNILLAPTASNPSHSPAGKICPYHHRVHKYRAIDFDRARKTDWTLKQHHYQQIGTLGRLLEMMELNIILEPWEY